MEMPRNRFKARLKAGESQVGLWVTVPSGDVIEALADSAADWLMLDTEHSPVDPASLGESLRAGAATSCLVRPSWNDVVTIKRCLDIGATTLMVPYVQNADEARAAVAAMRYPPRGVRGVSGSSRSSRYGRVTDYVGRAEEELCLLVQIETTEAMDRVEEIAAVDGVDGLFIGPADLAASMGMLGRMGDPAAKRAVLDGVARIAATGKAAGLLTLDPGFAREAIAAGSTVTGVGLDVNLLVRAADSLLAGFAGPA